MVEYAARHRVPLLFASSLHTVPPPGKPPLPHIWNFPCHTGRESSGLAVNFRKPVIRSRCTSPHAFRRKHGTLQSDERPNPPFSMVRGFPAEARIPRLAQGIAVVLFADPAGSCSGILCSGSKLGDSAVDDIPTDSRDRRGDLHGAFGDAAFREDHGDNHKLGRNGPDAGRDGPDVHDFKLVGAADGDGDGCGCQ